MKPFAIGTKVEVLYSPGDSAPQWTPATVINVVKPNMKGIGQHGNVVQLDNGKYLTVTEPGMIEAA
jgi:hypothetical protein